MIPMTPYSKEVHSVNVHGNSVTSTLTSTAASDSSSVHASPPQIQVDAMHQQVEGKKEDNGQTKIKEDLKTKKPVEKKKRRQWPKIMLNATFECTPKPKTPKPKTPKQAKPKRNLPLVKRKYTKRTKLDKKALVIVEDVITAVEHLPVEIVAKEPTKRVLDFDLNCQLEEVEVKDSIIRDLVSYKSPDESIVPLLRRGCRRSLQLRCQCCVCRIEKVKPAFPKEYKKIRTSSRIAKAKRRRLLPSKMSKEDIKEFLRCPLALTYMFNATTKKRKRRMNKFSKEMVKKTSIWNSVSIDQQIILNECTEPPRNEGIFDSPYEVNPSLPTNGTENQIDVISTITSSGLDHSTSEDHKKVTKAEKKHINSINKEAKVAKERKTQKDVVKVSKGKKKKNKEEKDIWENATTEERAEIITRKFEDLSLYTDLVELHASTQMEVNFDEETMQVWNLLKDRTEDGTDPIKEEEEEEEARKKWWDEQRKELLQKAGLFTIVMREILGDRSFSPWKGSVVDSVVGVFLTQNVSDSLSSSAYMSLAAKYPVKQPRENVQLRIEYNPASSHEQPEEAALEIPRSSQDSTSHLEDLAFEIPSSQDSMAHLEDLAFEIPSSQDPAVHLDNSNTPKQHIDANGNSNMTASSNQKNKKKGKETGDIKTDWDTLRTTYLGQNHGKPRNPDTTDSVDWDAVRKADVKEIAKAIEKRGQHNIMAQKIKDFLNRVVEDHGSIDLEWLRVVPPEKAKEYLLDIYGIGLKSVECLRLLTLHHHAFPVDVNVGRIAVRLGWIPLQPLPDFVQLHLLNNYPYMDKIQVYLWPRLCHLDQKTLYELHYLMITFGKVFCTTKRPHCKACPLRGQCKYYASASASSRLALPGSQQKSSKKASNKIKNPFVDLKPSSLVLSNPFKGLNLITRNYEPIIEEPPSPEPERRRPLLERDIEDLFLEDSDEISSIDLTNQRFVENDMSRAIVTLSSQASSRAPPMQKLIAKLRTEHRVYELPDTHPLLQGLAKREQDDPCPYLLAIWPQDEMCLEQNHQTVPGTFLIPSRSAMEGRFPLNGTYFQMNEVFVDDETSKCPINVPRDLIWNLQKRTVYCGTSTSTILRGLKMDQIQECFWRGYICIRAFNRRTRYPEELPSKFHERATATPNKKTDNIKRPKPIPRNKREATPKKTTEDYKD